MARRTLTNAVLPTMPPTATVTLPSPSPSPAAAVRDLRRRRRLRAAAAQRGASLVEIMAVLVILLIGVFLAIRIFPVGFGTLRANENRTAATRLAEQMLSLAKGDVAENLPQGILSAYVDTDPTSPTYNQLVVNTDQDPDDLTPYIDPSDSTHTPNLFFSDANRFHFIKGEQVKVPLPTANSTGSGSAYTVKFGPIYMENSVVGVDTNAPTTAQQEAEYDSYLKVTGAPLYAIQAQSNNPSSATAPPDGPSGNNISGRLRGPQSYLIDYGDDNTNAYIMFAPRAATSPARAIPYRTFTISYVKLNGGNGPVTGSTTVDVPDAAGAVWQEIPISPGSTTYVTDLVPGSVTVQRDFQRIANDGTTAWDTADPYQYKLANSNIPVSSGLTYANVGAILFNPAGANYTETTPYGERAFTAYIDYAVLNWHIIHDDIEVPNTAPDANGLVPIHLSIAPIKQSGDSGTDASGNPVVYNNLFNDANPADNVDLMAYDLSDNLPISANTIGNYRTPNSGDYLLTDEDPRGGSYRTGTIYVNTNKIKPGTTIRIMYQAEGDYAVSLQKAYSQYTIPAPGGELETRPEYGSYNTFGFDQLLINGNLDWYVIFPGCDLNKSVTLSIQYLTSSGDTTQPNTWVQLPPIQVTLDTLWTEPGQDNRGNTITRRFAVAKLLDYVPTSQQSQFSSAQGWQFAGSGGIGTAQGTSVKARVIWHDADVTNNRWRVHDLDSNLTPSP